MNDECDESVVCVVVMLVLLWWDVVVNVETFKEIVNFGFERFGFEDDLDVLNVLVWVLNFNCDCGLEMMGDVEMN